MHRRPIVSRSIARAGDGARPAAPAATPVRAAPEDRAATAGPDEPAAVPLARPSWLRGRIAGWTRRHERLFWLLALMTVGAVAGWGAWWRPDPAVPSMRDIDKAMRESIAKKPLASALAAAQAKVAPAVVRVRAERDLPAAPARAGKPALAPAPGGDARHAARPRLPGRDAPHSPDGSGPPEHPDGRSSIGTGVVVVADGTILTNLHVVSGNDRISVTFADGTQSRADLVSADPRIDLAVLRARVVPDDLQPAVLRSTHGLVPGQEVVAIGFPFGLGPSTTAGVVSGLGRRFGGPGTDAPMTGLIQFDAAANPGNSGGPLLTLDGAVVGIVTAIMNPTPLDTFIGIGFAVPIEAAMGAVGMSPF